MLKLLFRLLWDESAFIRYGRSIALGAVMFVSQIEKLPDGTLKMPTSMGEWFVILGGVLVGWLGSSSAPGASPQAPLTTPQATGVAKPPPIVVVGAGESPRPVVVTGTGKG